MMNAEVDLTLARACVDVFSTALVPNPFVRIACAFKSAALAFDNFKDSDQSLHAALVRSLRPALGAAVVAAFRKSTTLDAAGLGLLASSSALSSSSAASASAASVDKDSVVCGCSQQVRGDAELIGAPPALALVNSKCVTIIHTNSHHHQVHTPVFIVFCFSYSNPIQLLILAFIRFHAAHFHSFHFAMCFALLVFIISLCPRPSPRAHTDSCKRPRATSTARSLCSSLKS
jgi:hypothetical protein